MGNQTKKRLTKKEHRKKSKGRVLEIKNKSIKARKELIEFLEKQQKEGLLNNPNVESDVVNADQLELGEIESIE